MDSISKTTTTFQLTMESLDLPREYWDLKLEPQSPPSTLVASELFALNETTTNLPLWLYDDNFANGITLIGDAETAEGLQGIDTLELLSDEDLVVEFLDLKDEECLLDHKAPLHYNDYNDVSTNYQQIDVVSQPIIPITKVQVPLSSPSPTNLDFPQSEASSLILQQLTPPQSPPQFEAYQQPQPELKSEQKVLNYASEATNATTEVQFNNNWSAGSEIAREIQLVDDIVNMRAQELQLPTNWQQFNDDCESQDSSSLEGSSCSNSSSCSMDEEWLPELATSSTQSSPAHNSVEDLDQPATPKKRTRTYGRGVEDRKIRKKEQNKNAATRYRQKKKIEMEHVLGEEQQLTEENEALRRTLGERRHELRYLRQLIREFHQGRKH